MNGLIQDIRYALRQMNKHRGFTSIAMATLALGIGANTAIFGLLDSVFLRALPFREPQHLVHVWTLEADGDQHTPTVAQYQAVREDVDSFEQVAALGWEDYSYDAEGSVSQILPGRVVSPNWLATLGVMPLLGRNFREAEDNAGQDGVVMLSNYCWRTRFHADPNILGRQIVLNRRLVSVIAVLPTSLGPYYDDTEVFAPLVPDAYANRGYVRAGKPRVEMVARLRPGMTLGQARSEADVTATRHRNSASPAEPRLLVEDFRENLRHTGPTRHNAERGLLMTAVAAGVVLLIACANVVSLLMARSVTRYREVAVRAALGSSRARMIRQFLTESAVLFVCGGILALILARCCEEIVTKTAASMLPGVYLEVDARTFAVNLGVSLLTALAFGMIPALQTSHVNVNQSLKDGTVAGGTRSRRLRNTLVAGQVAMGMVLLVGFGLLLRSFLHVASSRMGYDPRNVLTATVRVPLGRYTSPSDRTRLMHTAVETIRLMPAVASVGIADSLPMEGAESAGMRVEQPTSKSTSVDEIYFVSISPEYFSTLQTPILSGRSFRETDGPRASLVAIVNETFAKHYFRDANPVGYHLAFADSPAKWREIVGVVSDFRQRNPEEDLRPMAYFPVAQTAPPRWSMAIRMRDAIDVASFPARIRAWLRPLDPELYWQLGSMQLQIHDSESLTLRRPMIALLASFGSLATLLVVVGVFGVTAFSVTERTREIGIRIALGAHRGEIAGLVLRESLVVSLAGLAVGTLCAFAATRLLPSENIGWSGSGIFLYGVSRMDAVTYLSVTALLTSVALAASYLPARRASKVDPMVALRYE